MFADMRDAAETVLDEMGRNFEPWVRRMIAEDKYVGWITSDGDRAVGSAGLLILDWAPHFLNFRPTVTAKNAVRMGHPETVARFQSPVTSSVPPQPQEHGKDGAPGCGWLEGE
jgi:hypothetical protein